MSFNRRSFVHLNGPFGEIRLGRDDAFTFLNVIGFDPFLTNGVGGTMALVMQGAPISTPNTVSYYPPFFLSVLAPGRSVFPLTDWYWRAVCVGAARWGLLRRAAAARMGPDSPGKAAAKPDLSAHSM